MNHTSAAGNQDISTNIKCQDPPPAGRIRVVPLGGLGEFGKNTMLLEFDRDMLMIDCGQKFPDHDMLGVDQVIPEFTYALEAGDRLRGLVLTHGHEDHIGAVPFLIRQMPYRRLPVYGSRLTLAFLHEKLLEMNLLDGVEMNEIHPDESVSLGVFTLRCFGVRHSIPDAMMIAIDTPAGRIVHTGDYRFDFDEQDRSPDLDAIASLAADENGVLLLMSDSTNVDREGFSPPEARVRDGLLEAIDGAPQSVIVAQFSSNINRMRSIFEVAEELGRKIAICGYSIERNFGIATRLGLLRYSAELIWPMNDWRKLPPDRRLLLTTGTQGEPMSALSRLALNSFRGYRVEPDDLIVFSSRFIPGNERAIYRLINLFYRHGAKVVTERDAFVHASGHAYGGELRRLIETLRPRYFMPIHGELRQLHRHAELARSTGIPANDVFILENGMQLTFDSHDAVVGSTEWSGNVLVDGRVMDEVGEVVLRDRKHLADDGMVTVILVIEQRTHRIIAGPEIVSRGFVVVDESEKLLEDCRRLVVRTFEECDVESQEEWDVVKVSVRKALRKYLAQATDRYPVIIPVVVEL